MDDRQLQALTALKEEADALQGQIKAHLPVLAAARRRYARSQDADDQRHLQTVQAEAEKLHSRISEIVKEMQQLIGIPDEVFEALDRLAAGPEEPKRLLRSQLTSDEVPSTGQIEEYLAKALEALFGVVDRDWLRSLESLPYRLNHAIGPLSLVRGLRRESEFPKIHRFAQALFVAKDFLEQHLAYDHFAGALLVPQIVSLGSKLPLLKNVGGPVTERVQSLWRGSSNHADATTFEILVAAGCLEKGRAVEFLQPMQEATPDLRCHDPFPLVVECKRKRALSDYELQEEREMVALFERLSIEARKTGQFGRYFLQLKVEADQAPLEEIVSCMLRQRLAGHPERPIEYRWGNVAYQELPRRSRVPRTRLYSPYLLKVVFGWESDLPEWDGLICDFESEQEMVVEEVRSPIGLLWTNTSERAIKKRSWGPMDVFGDAANQIPPGEFGVIYVAYNEGTREEIADLRTSSLIERVRKFGHSGKIRIPLVFFDRLYPRALKHGQPDLIENVVYCNAEYADAELHNCFPSPVFTADASALSSQSTSGDINIS